METLFSEFDFESDTSKNLIIIGCVLFIFGWIAIDGMMQEKKRKNKARRKRS